MQLQYDTQNQPPSKVNSWRRTDRSIHELIGIARGMLADGHVCADEVNSLVGWLDANKDATMVFPRSVLAERLSRICDDGRIDPDEICNLQTVLQQMAGGVLHTGMLLASTLPLNDPPPPIVYDGRLFGLTGHFAFGPRRICEGAIVAHGGRCASAVTMQTHYLVVGTFSSRDWTQSVYGRKIEKAVKLRAAGH